MCALLEERAGDKASFWCLARVGAARLSSLTYGAKTTRSRRGAIKMGCLPRPAATGASCPAQPSPPCSRALPFPAPSWTRHTQRHGVHGTDLIGPPSAPTCLHCYCSHGIQHQPNPSYRMHSSGRRHMYMKYIALAIWASCVPVPADRATPRHATPAHMQCCDAPRLPAAPCGAPGSPFRQRYSSSYPIVMSSHHHHVVTPWALGAAS